MSSLDTMRTRVNWMGGSKQIDRINEDKLRSLKKALLYAYQSGTIKLDDGREFRALINKDKLKAEYEDKILSVPFKDICLNGGGHGKTSEDLEDTGIKAGDTFTWISNNSDYIADSNWIVYLQYQEETAYFRAEIRECNEDVIIGDKTYHIWFKGPQQDALEWHQKNNIVWNDLNYTRVMYITKDETTLSLFKRFEQFYYNEDGILTYNKNKLGKPNRWEVQAVNPDYGDGLIRVAFKEYFGETAPENTVIENEPERETAIKGKIEVYPYDQVTYIVQDTGNSWTVDNKYVQIVSQDSGSCQVYIGTGKKGQFTLSYGDLSLVVKIKSL